MAEWLGWDIGGVHTKAACFDDQAPQAVRTAREPLEIWRQPEELVGLLRRIWAGLGRPSPAAMAVTMTAELSDLFATKAEGVLAVLDAVEAAFPGQAIYALDLSGRMRPLAEARRRPLDHAAANWLASALYLAPRQPDCLLLDIGSTTSDIIPIRGGEVATRERTDTGRLISGELVYSGVVRTNPNTVVDRAPLRGEWVRLAAENFCLMGDVYLILGDLTPAAYDTPTPDGRDRSPAAARARLARLVCADSETLDAGELEALARYLAEKQLQQIGEAVLQVLSRGAPSRLSVLPAGSGAFLARRLARRLDLRTVAGASVPAGEVLPCLAAAALLAEELTKGAR